MKRFNVIESADLSYTGAEGCEKRMYREWEQQDVLLEKIIIFERSQTEARRQVASRRIKNLRRGLKLNVSLEKI